MVDLEDRKEDRKMSTKPQGVRIDLRKRLICEESRGCDQNSAFPTLRVLRHFYRIRHRFEIDKDEVLKVLHFFVAVRRLWRKEFVVMIVFKFQRGHHTDVFRMIFFENHRRRWFS